MGLTSLQQKALKKRQHKIEKLADFLVDFEVSDRYSSISILLSDEEALLLGEELNSSGIEFVDFDEYENQQEGILDIYEQTEIIAISKFIYGDSVSYFFENPYNEDAEVSDTYADLTIVDDFVECYVNEDNFEKEIIICKDSGEEDEEEDFECQCESCTCEDIEDEEEDTRTESEYFLDETIEEILEDIIHTNGCKDCIREFLQELATTAYQVGVQDGYIAVKEGLDKAIDNL